MGGEEVEKYDGFYVIYCTDKSKNYWRMSTLLIYIMEIS